MAVDVMPPVNDGGQRVHAELGRPAKMSNCVQENIARLALEKQRGKPFSADEWKAAKRSLVAFAALIQTWIDCPSDGKRFSASAVRVTSVCRYARLLARLTMNQRCVVPSKRRQQTPAYATGTVKEVRLRHECRDWA